jgi:two-component system invasion response regulator UvrY
MGAAGYATKDCPWDELVEGVKKILAGRNFFKDTWVAGWPSAPTRPSATSILQKLPKREEQILKLIIAGHSMKEIASKLSLVPSTVSTYRARLLNRFGFRSNAELVRFATENSLLLNRVFVRRSHSTTKP